MTPIPRQMFTNCYYHTVCLNTFTVSREVHAGVPDGTVGTTVLSALPEGIEPTGVQEVHGGIDAANRFPCCRQRLGNPLLSAVGS